MSAKLGTANAPAAEGNRPTGQVDARSLQDRLAALSGDAAAQPTLGALADPALFTGAVEIDGWSGAELRRMLESMIAIRSAEEQLGRMVEDGEIVCTGWAV